VAFLLVDNKQQNNIFAKTLHLSFLVAIKK